MLTAKRISPKIANTRELASELRVSTTYIKEHASDLGGSKNGAGWTFDVDQARERLLEIWPR